MKNAIQYKKDKILCTWIKMINDEMRNNIKELTNSNYGFIPEDVEINTIDSRLSESYLDLHEYRIINHLATRAIYDSKLSYWSTKSNFAYIVGEKLIFRFLRLAIKCFNEANNYASICLCRTAIESGLIERVAEEYANRDSDKNKCYEQKLLFYINQNKDKMLHRNLELAEELNIISKRDVEDMFERNVGVGVGKRILNKFVHGDIIDIVKTSNNPEVKEDDLNQIKWIADNESYRIGYNILKITIDIAEKLYFE